jgi:hypothetical protein
LFNISREITYISIYIQSKSLFFHDGIKSYFAEFSKTITQSPNLKKSIIFIIESKLIFYIYFLRRNRLQNTAESERLMNSYFGCNYLVIYTICTHTQVFAQTKQKRIIKNKKMHNMFVFGEEKKPLFLLFSSFFELKKKQNYQIKLLQ